MTPLILRQIKKKISKIFSAVFGTQYVVSLKVVSKFMRVGGTKGGGQ